MRIQADSTNEEVAELLKALLADENHPKATRQCADIAIVLALPGTVTVRSVCDRKWLPRLDGEASRHWRRAQVSSSPNSFIC